MIPNNKVSVIVPVFNSEDYLSSCIESILNQTYTNFELILVNDGSSDNSGKICEYYSKIDNRIKVLHQKNSGPSMARNTGINVATGKFIQFVDSDDIVEHDMTQKLVQSINKDIELVICGYKVINIQNGKVDIQKINLQKHGVYNIKEFLSFFGKLYKNSLINSPCNKLYVREILQKNEIKFLDNLNMGEDLLFNLEYLKICNKISIIHDSLYNYMVNSNSLTHTFYRNLFENQKLLFSAVRNYLKDTKSYTDENVFFVETLFTEQIVWVINNLFHKNNDMNFKQRKERIKIIINDETVRNNIKYFYFDNIQKRFVGCMIKHKKINIIYFYFNIKELVRDKIKPLFYFMKKLTIK